jgi:hypothetical protein
LTGANAVGHDFIPGTPPRFGWVREFDVLTGADLSAEFEVLNDGVRL